ncbi:riboflavin synthase [Conexibacter woesei]|uniref:riboflavin synthase n=1 Tax=Conexibacter woesei TaxID=191495 RepID=UPI00040B74E9|nr:riboflavin synthase [Conexibacter woesei]
MFTGLVEDLGEVVAVDAGAEGSVLTVASRLTDEVGLGDSVAVNGVCLTATRIEDGRMSFDVMLESLRRSSLGGVEVGSGVNLELAMKAGARLGGHIMQGHVDGIGSVSGIAEDGFSRVVTIDAPADLLKYVVEKGSIAVDGISLTVSRVDDTSFDVSLIPETLERTNLGGTAVGRTVNLEVDVVAKYVEKLVGVHAR